MKKRLLLQLLLVLFVCTACAKQAAPTPEEEGETLTVAYMEDLYAGFRELDAPGYTTVYSPMNSKSMADNSKNIVQHASMPDVFFVSDINQIQAAIKLGYFAELDDAVLAESAPTIHGNIRMNDDLIRLGCWHRYNNYAMAFVYETPKKAILAKTNKAYVPDSVSGETYRQAIQEAGARIKAAGADGVYALCPTGRDNLIESVNDIFCSFTCDLNAWIQVNGTIKRSFHREGFVQSVRYLKSLYDSGLIPQDFIKASDRTEAELFCEGRLAFCGSSCTTRGIDTGLVVDADRAADMVLICLNVELEENPEKLKAALRLADEIIQQSDCFQTPTVMRYPDYRWMTNFVPKIYLENANDTIEHWIVRFLTEELDPEEYYDAFLNAYIGGSGGELEDKINIEYQIKLNELHNIQNIQ